MYGPRYYSSFDDDDDLFGRPRGGGRRSCEPLEEEPYPRGPRHGGGQEGRHRGGSDDPFEAMFGGGSRRPDLFYGKAPRRGRGGEDHRESRDPFGAPAGGQGERRPEPFDEMREHFEDEFYGRSPIELEGGRRRREDEGFAVEHGGGRRRREDDGFAVDPFGEAGRRQRPRDQGSALGPFDRASADRYGDRRFQGGHRAPPSSRDYGAAPDQRRPSDPRCPRQDFGRGGADSRADGRRGGGGGYGGGYDDLDLDDPGDFVKALCRGPGY